jgi:hypothetical protein
MSAVVEHAMNANCGTTRALGRRRIVLWLVAAAHVAFVAICTPVGVRSGEWAVPGLPDPDTLVFVASGATTIFPLVLLPLWVGLGCGDFLRRFATNLLFCLVLVGAVSMRTLVRDFHEPQVFSVLFVSVANRIRPF